MLLKIGMRNIKTAIAVMLSILAIRILNMESPFYACIAAVITMQNKINVSYETGLHRMIGTLIGAAIGILFSLIWPQNIILTTIGIILIIFMANVVKQKNSINIACIVFLAIMTNVTNLPPLQYSIDRVLETFVGILLAVVVNSYLFPPKKI